MTEQQVRDEIQGVIRLINEVSARFGFSYEIELSTRPDNSIGSDEEWELATMALTDAVSKMGKSYAVNEKETGHFTILN